MQKHHKLFKKTRLALIGLVIVVLTVIAFYITPKGKTTQPIQVNLPYNFRLTAPSNWHLYQKPLPNQIVLLNDGEGDSRCFIDVFVVQPDHDYTFKQWLDTSILNKIFFETGKETTYKDKQMFVGSYSFVDNYFKEQVQNQRVILKGGATLADIHMSYKTNQNCQTDFQNIFESVSF